MQTQIFTNCIYIYANTKVISFIIDLVNDMQILLTHPTELSMREFKTNQSTVCLKNKKQNLRTEKKKKKKKKQHQKVNRKEKLYQNQIISTGNTSTNQNTVEYFSHSLALSFTLSAQQIEKVCITFSWTYKGWGGGGWGSGGGGKGPALDEMATQIGQNPKPNCPMHSTHKAWC